MISRPGAGEHAACWDEVARAWALPLVQESKELTKVPVISVIDDDASVRTAINNLVTSLGHTVHVFDSAEAFLQSAQLNNTCCVIADIRMPAMSGIELQSHL